MNTKQITQEQCERCGVCETSYFTAIPYYSPADGVFLCPGCLVELVENIWSGVHERQASEHSER